MPYQDLKSFDWRDGLASLGLLALTAALDYLTGYSVPFFLFYLVPIIFTLRRLGWKYGMGMCVLSILSWIWCNSPGDKIHFGWPNAFWSITLCFLLFLLVVNLLTERARLVKREIEYKDVMDREARSRQRLEREVLEASEREQRNIGHDLHDNLCQQLTASALAAKVLANQLKAQSRPEAQTAEQLTGMVEKAIEFTRTLTRSLSLVGMKNESLVDGLRELAADVSNEGKAACQLACSQNISLATLEANMHLYRIAQEAIGHAIRHGAAKNILIGLQAANQEIILTISDDGNVRSSETWTRDALGLQIMHYRAGMISADLKVESQPAGGSRLICRLPAPAPTLSKPHVE